MADNEERPQQEQQSQGCEARAKWFGIAKSIAYELRPFTLPTKKDLQQAGQLVKTNANQIRAEVERLAPEVWKVVKSLEPSKLAMVCGWLLGWAVFIWLEFGAVYFIVSAMAMIFTNLGERAEGEWSAYSVFNAGCKALLGTINVEQFERELMHRNPAGPPVDGQRHQEPDLQPEEPEDLEYVFVEALGNPNEDENAPGNGEEDDDHYNSDGADEGGAGAGMVPAPAGAAAATAARARARKVSGKRARRGFAERRERQEERRLALEAFGQHQWD